MRLAAPFVVLACSLLLALAPRSVHAQGGVNGSIEGSVYDQTGNPIKGVKITARSDTQIGGPKVTYTNDEGYFRLPGLLPGIFEVQAAAPKLKTVIQKDVNVGIQAPANIDLVMEVETTVEEIKVVEKAPIVSTTSANVKEVYDAEFVENLPTESRWMVEDIVGKNTAGATGSGRSIRVRGAGSGHNAFNVEGFYMNGQKVTVKSLAALEVSTAGHGADGAAAPGGVVNMVSKSGSNKYEFDVSGWFLDSNMRFFTDEGDSENHSWNYMVNPAFSGPIIKDRLWFYLNTEARNQNTERSKDISGYRLTGPTAPGDWYQNTRASLKLTWQVTTRNKLSTYSNVNRDWHRWEGDADRDEREAYHRFDHFDFFHGIIWESLLTDNLFLRSQVGYQQFWEERKPERCTWDPECDHVQQVRNSYPRTLYHDNYELHEQRISRSIEVINQLEWFIHSKQFGEHNVKFKSRLFDQLFESAQSTPGDGYQQWRGAEPELQRTYYSNDPRLEPGRLGWRIRGTTGLTTVHSVQDSMRLTRYLTFTPGVAYTHTFASNVGDDTTQINNGGMTTHLAVAWDATHDGRTVLRGSFNQYMDVDSLRLARFSLGDRVYRECRWNSSTERFDSECRYGGGSAGRRTFGLPCGPSGVNLDGTSCKEEMRIPKTWEYTAGAEREIIQGVGLGADLIYRLYTYPYQKRETNRIWDDSGYGRERLGGYRNGRSETIEDLGTPADARKRYIGVTGTIRKREGALKTSFSYTWQKLEGNFDNNEDGDFGVIPARDRYYLYGPLGGDQRHVVKTSLTYQATRWLSLGYIWRYYSGSPYSRLFRNDELGNFSDYRARVGQNPGGNVNDPSDDRPLRRPDIMEMNVQVRTNLRPLTGINLEAFADVLNILALRTHTGVEQNDGPLFGRPTSSRMSPMRMQIGFRYRY